MAQVNVRVDDSVNEKRIPFEVAIDPFYDSEHMAILEHRIADMKAGRNVHEHELIEES